MRLVPNDQGVPSGEDFLASLFRGQSQVDLFRVPVDSGRKNALGRQICNSFTESNRLALNVTERGIWESSENALPFDTFIRCTADNGSDYDGEHQFLLVFSGNEIESLVAATSLCLTNIWGFVLSDAHGSSVVVDHDEVIVFAPKTEEQRSHWLTIADSFQLSRVS